MQIVLTPDLVLEAYRHGIFPMAYGAQSPYVHWVCPDMRGQLPVAEFHVPARLRKTLRRMLSRMQVGCVSERLSLNEDFAGVIRGCAAPQEKRRETWINEAIMRCFTLLHKQGHAHSIEYWRDGVLAGGVYGVALGGAFFAESMFSAVPEGSKIALCALAARLWAADFKIFDTQFINDHLLQFGAYELPHKLFIEHLHDALPYRPDFLCSGKDSAVLLEAFLKRPRSA